MIWIIAAATLLLILARPWRVSEGVWACSGAALLVAFRIVSPGDALAAVGRGTDVYLFLTGMMLLAELARREGVFDWIAAEAVQLARGSRVRLFAIVYGVGTLVTVFLSNDATAVVLTPAVLAAVRKARATPLPYLLICAFIANAASFVLPISNPANLVVYGSKIPPLGAWLKAFGLPSVVAIAVTFLVLRFALRKHLRDSIKRKVDQPELSGKGKVAAGGIVGAGVVLMIASSFGFDLGLPTLLAGLLVAIIVGSPFGVLKHISWSVLFLVAGLFVMVAAVDQAGVLELSLRLLQQAAEGSAAAASLGSAFGVALMANVVNNLPVGLIAGSAMQGAHLPQLIRNAVLIGVDLGPNLSITGSLATILWLVALRREGEEVGFFGFLRYGVLVTAPALVLSVLTLVLIN